MLPHEIRELRQKLTQQELASALGVSRLTVHRWELPLHHPESRRPQGKTLKKLMLFKESGTSSRPTFPPCDPFPTPFANLDLDLSGLTPEEAHCFRQALEALEWGHLAHCLSCLVTPKTHPSPHTQRLLWCCRVYQGLFQDNQPTALHGVVEELLREAAEGPALLQQLTHQAAAFYFAWPNQACFHPDRAFFHAALAIRAAGSATAPLAMHGHAARMQAALYQGERRLHGFFVLDAEKALWAAHTPFSTGLGLEAAAHHAHHQGWIDEARGLFQKLTDHGEAFGLGCFERRGYAGLSNNLYFGGGTVPETLALLQKGLSTQGPPDAATLAMQGLRARLAVQELSFEAATRLMEEGDALETTLGWRDSHLLFTRLLLSLIQENPGRLESLSDSAQEFFTPTFPNKNIFTMLNLLRGWCALARGRLAEAMHHWQLALETSRRLNVIDPLARNAYFALFFINLTGGKSADAQSCWNDMQQQEDWVQGLPFIYLMQAYWGLFLALRGQWIEGELEAMSARFHFQYSQDHFNHLLTRRFTALIQDLAKSPGHEQALAQTGRDLERHGVNPSLYSRENIRFIANQTPQRQPSAPSSLSRKELQTAWMIKHLCAPGHSFDTLCRVLVNLVEEITRGRPAALLLWTTEETWTALVRTPLQNPHHAFEFFAAHHGRMTLQVQEPVTAAEIALISPLLDVAARRLSGFTQNWAGRFLQGTAPGDSPRHNGQQREALLELAANLDTPLLIQAPPGQDAESFARRLHTLSDNRNGPFVCMSLQKISQNQQVQVLFGATADVTSGAAQQPGGLVQDAQGGVLFIPDLSLLSGEAQKELFDHLEKTRRWFTDALAGGPPLFRLMAATSRPLTSLEKGGLFHPPLLWALQPILMEI